MPPLGSFLDEVHAQGIPLGIRARIDCERLHRAWGPDVPADQLRDGLASLLARSPQEWTEIARRFDAWLRRSRESVVPEEESDGPSEDDAGKPAASRPLRARLHELARRVSDAPRDLWIALLGTTALLVVGLFLLWQDDRSTPDSPTQEDLRGLPVEPLQVRSMLALREIHGENTQDIDVQPAPLEAPTTLGVLGVLSASLLLFGIRWLWLPRAGFERRQREKAERRVEQLAERERLDKMRSRSPLRALDYSVERHPPLSERAVADSAEWLARLQCEETGLEIDPDATVRRSSEEAGRFTPVLARRRSPVELLLWIDVESGDHPWLGSFECLVDAWQRLGIRLCRYAFYFDPADLVDCVTRRSVSLAELARRHGGAPLILFSRQLIPARWMSECAAWPRRGWLDPDPRSPREWPSARRADVAHLERMGFPRFSLSEGGLSALARALGGDGAPRSLEEKDPLPPLPRAEEDPRTPRAEALRKWALAGALVPDPTWDQLEAIRRHFPEIAAVFGDVRALQRLLEWVARDTGASAESRDGRRLFVPPPAEDRWILEQRALEKSGAVTPDFEKEVHRLLFQQLVTTEPKDPLHRLWWRFKSNYHRAFLEPERAALLLSDALAPAIAPEGERWVARELARQEKVPGVGFPIGVRDALTEQVGRPGGVRLRLLALGHGRLWAMATAVSLLWGMLELPALPALDRWITPHWTHPATTSMRFLGVSSLELERTIGGTANRPALVVLLGGRFSMGSPESEKSRDSDELLHEVMISPFVASQTEITQGQYAAVMSGAAIDADCAKAAGVGKDLPMVCVRWDDAIQYCNRLSKFEGRDPAYEITRNGTVRWDRKKNGYRLLTEAEWEYAARGGERTIWVGTNDPNEVCAYGNVWDRAAKASESGFSCDDGYAGLAPVEAHRANQFGLFGMGGNAAEWVWDWYGDYERAAPGGVQTDPVGPEAGSFRVFRGASWSRRARSARVAYRSGSGPSGRGGFVGFRVARSPLPSEL